MEEFVKVYGEKPESLDTVDTQGLKSAFDVFAEKSKEFVQLSALIKATNESLGLVWGGPAYKEYDSQFDFIFAQVSDIGDALIDITEGLKLAYTSYETADDDLYQQMQEAAHNSAKDSGNASQASSANLKPVLYSTLGTAYIPSLVFQPLPAKPALVSTMGAAYKPDLNYAIMSPKPQLNSCLPCARLISLLYQTMAAKSSLASIIGAAVQAVIDWLAMQNQSSLRSTIGAATMADVTYQPMQPKDVLSSTMGAAEAADITYQQMQGRGALSSTIGAAEAADVTHQQMQGLDTLSSTMGAAEAADVTHQQMQGLDALSSTMGAAEAADITYQQMQERGVLSSTMGAAEAADITYQQMQERDVLSSTIPGIFTPDLSYSPLPVKPLLASDLAAALNFMKDYAEAAGNLRDLKNQLMAATVNQVALQSLLNNLSPEDTALKLGNAILDKIYGKKLDGDLHGQLAALLGNTLYNQMFSSGSGQANLLDTAQEVSGLASLVEQVVVSSTASVPFSSLPVMSNEIHQVVQASDINPSPVFKAVMQQDVRYTPVNIQSIAMLPTSVEQVDSAHIASIASHMADAGNRSAVESLLQQTVNMKSGAASVLPITPTRQTVQGMVVSIEAGDFSLSSDAVHQLIGQQLSSGCAAEMSKIVQAQSSQMTQYDFSPISFPIPATLSSPALI